MTGKIDYSIRDYVLEINPLGVKVSFPWPIAEVVSFEDRLVVRVESSPGKIFNENVFAVTLDGQIVWNIEKRKHVYKDSPYIKIVAESNNVRLFNWDGDELLVEVKNGNILESGYGK